jgi:hypothetical protein
MAMEAPQMKPRVMGAVDFVIIQFPGARFTGQFAPELRRLEDEGIVRVIDILFISKDEMGRVESFEIEDLGDVAVRDFRDFVGKIGGWLSQDDVEFIGSELPNNSRAAAILYENAWMVKLKSALVNAGAELVAQGRVPPSLINEVIRRSASSRRM